ncbi:MAG: hypothetical protein ABIA63_10870, partial [bacterium]
MKLTFFCLLFFCFFLKSPYTKIIFESSFEDGATNTAESIKAGDRKIDLIENFQLERWPLKNGKGIIESNYKSNSDKFTYKQRRGNKLSGVKGLNHNHPKGVIIFCQGLEKWDEISPDICLTDSAAIFSDYSCLIPVSKDIDRRVILKSIMP